MRRLTAVMTAFFAVLLLSFTAKAADFAENGVNLLKDYSTLEWSGRPLEYSSEHKTLNFSVSTDSRESALAYTEFPVGDKRGFVFYADLGSYSGEAAGNASVLVLDEGGGVIKEYVCDIMPPDGSFRRCQLGSSEEPMPLPENAFVIRAQLCKGAGNGSPYFRNLYLSLTEEAGEAEQEWAVSGKLELVQTRVARSQYWVWVTIIVIVPLIMFGTRKMIDKAKKVK